MTDASTGYDIESSRSRGLARELELAVRCAQLAIQSSRLNFLQFNKNTKEIQLTTTSGLPNRADIGENPFDIGENPFQLEQGWLARSGR